MTLEQKVGVLLKKNRQTLCVAESCSGGLLGHRLTNVSGSSNYFLGGIIAYANKTKIKLLTVKPSLINKFGAVSRPVAKVMATSVRKILKTDFGISITGIAGPTGGTIEKPVGLTYIAVASTRKIVCQEFYFKGPRLAIKTQAAESALKLLLKIIK